MLLEVSSHGHLRPSDLRAYLSIQRLARWLEHPDATEYWKSSPYLMSFMESYQLKAANEAMARRSEVDRRGPAGPGG